MLFRSIETHIRPIADFSYAEAKTILERLKKTAQELLDRDEVPIDKRVIKLHAHIRYVGQSYELAVEIGDGKENAWIDIVQSFHQTHKQRFGHADPKARLEIVSLSVTGIGKVDPPVLPELPKGTGSLTNALIGNREVYFERNSMSNFGKWHLTSIYERVKLLAGDEVIGPAVVVEESSTTVLYPNDSAVVQNNGSLLITVGDAT